MQASQSSQGSGTLQSLRCASLEAFFSLLYCSGFNSFFSDLPV